MTTTRWFAAASRLSWMLVAMSALGSCRRGAEGNGAAPGEGAASVASGGALASGAEPSGTAAKAAVASTGVGSAGTAVVAPSAAGDALPNDAAAAKLVAATARTCRIMVLRGAASFLSLGKDAPRPVVQGDLLPEGALIEMSQGAELTAQATVSTRELTLVGPALFEACPQGQEEVRLSHGTMNAFPGAGVRPGAEVWVATALGTVRFNDANLAIEIPSRDGEALSVTVRVGQAWFMPAPNVRLGDGASGPSEGAMLLAPGTVLAATRPPLPVTRWGKELVAWCTRSVSAAAEARQRVVDGGARALGEIAAAHVRARQNAHGACSSARAAAALGPLLRDENVRSELEKAEHRLETAL